MVPKRLPASIRGLNQFVNYINQYVDTQQLTILEVGSWAGSSAEVFAKRFENVICVDCWEVTKGTVSEKHNVKEAEKEFDKIKAKYKNIYKIKHRIEDIINEFPDKRFDIIYIDACHTYEAVKRDIQLCLPKCKLFISGHDYWPRRFDGVIKAVNEILGKPDKIFPDTSWLKKMEV